MRILLMLLTLQQGHAENILASTNQQIAALYDDDDFTKSDPSVEAKKKAEIEAARVATEEKIGLEVGKIFRVTDNDAEIIGKGIARLSVGREVTIQTQNGLVVGRVTQLLHTKAKVKIANGRSVAANDRVFLRQ